MRKTRVKGGDQHAMSVRIDNEIWEWLQGEANKNRLINDLLRFWKKAVKKKVCERITIHTITFIVLYNPEFKFDEKN